MGRIVVIAAGIYLALLIAALADCLGADEPPRRLTRGAWALIIVLLPILGGILWFTSGRRRKPTGGATGRRPLRRPPPPPLAPDDDPDFLRDLERKLREDNDDR